MLLVGTRYTRKVTENMHLFNVWGPIVQRVLLDFYERLAASRSCLDVKHLECYPFIEWARSICLECWAFKYHPKILAIT